MRFLSLAYLTVVLVMGLSSIHGAAANQKDISVLSDALDMMAEAQDTHKNNRMRLGQDIDEIFGKNLDKLVEKGVVRKLPKTFIGDDAVGAYRIGNSIEIWIRKRAPGTGTSLDAVYWEFERNANGKLTAIKGKGVDTYTTYNPKYSKPIHIESNNRLSLEPGVLSKDDLAITKRRGLDSSQMRRKLSHFGSKITTGQHWVNDISIKLRGMDEAELRKLNIPGTEGLGPEDVKKVQVRLTMDQKASFLWADRAQNVSQYNQLRHLDAARSKEIAKADLTAAKAKLNRAKLATGGNAATELAAAREEHRIAAKRFQQAESRLLQVESDIAKGQQASKVKTPRKAKTPARIPKPAGGSKVMQNVGKVLKGLGYSAAVVTGVLIANNVSAKSREFNQVYVARGLAERFEQGRFREARRYWDQEVVNLQNPPATELFDAITQISGIYASTFAVAWEKSMRLTYEDLEKVARASFLAHYNAIKAAPARFDQLAKDADLRLEILSKPPSMLFAGEAFDIKAKVYVMHDFGDYGDYAQPVIAAPLSISWDGLPLEQRRILADEFGVVTANGFGTGEVVWDDSLGKGADRTRIQASFHTMLLSIPEWTGDDIKREIAARRYSVAAYDYIVSRIPQSGNRDLAHANGKDAIEFELKLQQRSRNASGEWVYYPPVNYRRDFDHLGVSTGMAASGPMGVSPTGNNFQPDIKVRPAADSGSFRLFAVADTWGENELRLDLRGIKYRRYYMEVAKYSVEFKNHPVDFRIGWGPTMKDLVKGGVLKLSDRAADSLIDQPIEIFAVRNSDGSALEGARLEFKIEPANGAKLIHTFAETETSGRAEENGKLPRILNLKPGTSEITITAEGAVNSLKIITEAKPESGAEVSRLETGTTKNLVRNGSFEVGVAPGGFITLGRGSAAIDSWTVTRDTIDYVGSYFRASDGVRSIDLAGTPGNGGVAQEITTRPDASYRVEFDLAGNPDCGSAAKSMSLKVAKQKYEVEQPPRLNWETHSWQFKADENRTRLVFRSERSDGGSCGALLDNVRVFEIAASDLPLNSTAGEATGNCQDFSAGGSTFAAQYSDSLAKSFEVTADSRGTLSFEYLVPAGHCSDIRLNYKLDDNPGSWTNWLGYSGSTEGLPLRSGKISFSKLQPNSSHRLTLNAQGRAGGCNDGALSSWGGRVCFQNADNRLETISGPVGGESISSDTILEDGEKNTLKASDSISTDCETIENPGPAASIVSNFDRGAEGWTLVQNFAGGGASIPELDRGAIKGEDQAGHVAWYFVSAEKFLGDKSRFYDGCFEFDLKTSKKKGEWAPSVSLFGADLITWSKAKGTVSDSWGTFRIPITSCSDWFTRETIRGADRKSKKSELLGVLRNLKGIYVLGEYVTGSDEGWLDNFRISSNCD